NNPAAMPPSQSLDSLPFDVFYQIATSLDDRDCIQLSRTNRALHACMESDLIARKTVENVLLYSKEGQSALAGRANYRKAVGHRFDIHEAVATASPYSVSVLAYAVDYAYHQGCLCYRVGHEIRLLDVHAAGREERVLNLHEILTRLESGVDAVDRVSLLRYSDEIVVFRVEGIGAQDDLLLAIDMRQRTDPTRRRRLLLQKIVPASVPIFVRHSRSYLWYGTFTAVDGSGGVWSVCGVDLATFESVEFPLDRVVDGDLGQSFCFEMYQEHLYVVSSDEDERFSSFYHWFCYAPRQKDRKGHGRLWRREHREGPINDMWTDLSICTDESTGRPVILECRREWPDGKSENHRTNYTEPLPTPKEALAAESEGGEDSGPPAWKGNDFNDLATTSQSYNQRPEKRIRRNYHAEYDPPYDPTQRHDFIAARTKHRSYHLAANTFVDLVNDPAPQADGVRPQDRLRLRTVSRKRKSPIDEEGLEGPKGLLFRPTQAHADGKPVEGSEERFISCGVHMWPPENAPAEIQRILCPDARIGSLHSISDDRSLIYSTSCAGLPPDHKALVLISFDPTIRFPTMTSLHRIKAPALPDTIIPVEMPRPRSSKQNASLIKVADPLYQAIDWGYWLR
ncbi:uncharacterized protein N7459_000185, partial [Penicillium hispanicum]|uniref:uncharacterized protein n=1 Tax=Penicillium hispanicum TaxID=1080232 RepID=UPI002541F6D4